MDFRIAYDRFIKKHKELNKKSGLKSTRAFLEHKWTDGKQVHHILPKKLGGRNIASNFVALDPKSHAYAHVLLNLALLQEGNLDTLKLLNYASSSSLPISFLMKQNALKKIKIAIFLEGKKHPPLTLSLKEAAKYFCFIAKKNFNNHDALNQIAGSLLRNSIFGIDWYGIRTRIAFTEKVNKDSSL